MKFEVFPSSLWPTNYEGFISVVIHQRPDRNRRGIEKKAFAYLKATNFR